jgi:hypothetical protein
MPEYTYNAEYIRTELRNTWDSHDSWGECMSWMFDICDSLFWTHGETPPFEWMYNPGLSDPYDPAEEDGWSRRSMLDKTDPQDLIALGNKLHRMDRILRAQGKDY